VLNVTRHNEPIYYRYQLRSEVAKRRTVGNSKKQQADLYDKRIALQRQIYAWRQAQLVYTPHAATMVASSTSLDENGFPRVEVAENTPLFLPSSFPSHIQSLSEMERICNMEKRLRLAQAEDALVKICRQRRIVQGLWQFKRLNMTGMGNRPNTKMLTLYNRISDKIERAAQKYHTARVALLLLDPEGTWNDRLKELRREDIRGPSKDDPNDRKTSNGRFEPSWIWLVQRNPGSTSQTKDEFNASMKVEWARTHARMMRWDEEYNIVQEEMRRVLAWFEWKALWWEEQADRRAAGQSDVLHGASAYAHKQAHIAHCMALRCAADWLPVLRKLGIEPAWGINYPQIKGDEKDSTDWNTAPRPSEVDDRVDVVDDDDDGIDVQEVSSDEEDDEDVDYFDFDDYWFGDPCHMVSHHDFSLSLCLICFMFSYHWLITTPPFPLAETQNCNRCFKLCSHMLFFGRYSNSDWSCWIGNCFIIK